MFARFFQQAKVSSSQALKNVFDKAFNTPVGVTTIGIFAQAAISTLSEGHSKPSSTAPLPTIKPR